MNYERARREIAELRERLPGRSSTPDLELVDKLRKELDAAWVRVGEAAEEASGDIFDERVDAALEAVREISRAIDEARAGQPLCEVFGQGPADLIHPDDQVLAGARVARKRLMHGRRIVDENGVVRVVRPE